MRTLTKILEKIGENMAWAGWMYGTPVPRPPYYPRPRNDDADGHRRPRNLGRR